ncbi:hypothetical protein HU200_018424 [Digitaria exilis]|uniref:Uncharacterized protein n=1 Tax=Digitaria exilis TaxID=1010633 RepID=A0A835KHJ1_9POAL|nr:hypothetical protein HU200_018424 [Digitaria exilis]
MLTRLFITLVSVNYSRTLVYFLSRFAILGWDHITDESGEDDNQVAPNDHPKGSSGLASKEPKQQKENSNSDFLEGTFLKISSDKQKVMTNKKNSKNKKKKKGKSRKRYHASEMQSEVCTGSSSACANTGTSGENLSFSSSYVAIDVPLFDYSSSSPSSRVIELISPVSSVSSSNDKELSSNSNDFRSFSTSSYYSVPSSPVNDCSSGSNASVTNESYAVSNACNNTGGDDAGSLSDVRTEWSWSATGLTDDYQGFNKWSESNLKEKSTENEKDTMFAESYSYYIFFATNIWRTCPKSSK